MHLRSEHLLNCSAEELWRLSFNCEFDRQHAMTAMRMREHEALSCTTSGETWQLRTRSTPSSPIPKFVQRFVPAFSTETTFTHRPGTDYGVGVLRASVMPEQIHMSFRLEVIPEPSGGCRRIMEW